MKETKKYVTAHMSHAIRKEFAVSVCIITEREVNFPPVILLRKWKPHMIEVLGDLSLCIKVRSKIF